jgi:CIC family chloride channel protein
METTLTRADILQAFDKDPAGTMTVREAGSARVVVTYPDELLSEASAKMLRHNIGRLPVVDRNDPARILGYLGRPGIMSARLRRRKNMFVSQAGLVGYFESVWSV